MHRLAFALVISGWWYAIDTNGVVIGHKVDPEPTLAEFNGSTQIVSDDYPSLLAITLGNPFGDEGEARWEYVNDAMQARDSGAIETDRVAKKKARLLPKMLKAYKEWQDAVTIKSVDDAAITTAEVDALQTTYDGIKADRDNP
jgi:hypothetical protein